MLKQPRLLIPLLELFVVLRRRKGSLERKEKERKIVE